MSSCDKNSCSCTKVLGLVLIVLGILLLVIFLPLKFWGSLFGAILVVLGVMLRLC